MNRYCLQGDYVMLNTILNVQFAEMYVNVLFVKLFVQCNEFTSC